MATKRAISSGEAPSRKTLTLTHGKEIFGLEAIGIAALPSTPAIMQNNIIKSVVLNLFTAVETIPILVIYIVNFIVFFDKALS